MIIDPVAPDSTGRHPGPGDLAGGFVVAGARTGAVGGFLLRGSPTAVEVWSSVRLPFEPRGWLVDLRRELRTALAAMPAAAGQVLHAVYAAAPGDFVDVENVLLYNVGPAAFGHLMTTGVRFERSYTPPAPEGSGDGQPMHYHRYELAAADGPFAHWAAGEVLARFTGIRVDRIDRPAAVFTAIRRGAAPPARAPDREVPPWFGVRLTLHRPAGDRRRLANLVKPVLDGLISAVHQHDGTDLDQVADRLAAAGDGPRATVLGDLQDDRWRVLDRRRLVRPTRAGVQWNPADDLCLAAVVQLGPPSTTADWTLTADLIALHPIEPVSRLTKAGRPDAGP